MVGTTTFDATNNVITTVGGTSGTPIAFIDLWDADVAGTRTLRAAAASPFTGSLTTPVKPTEKLALKLSAVITAHSVNGTVAFTGKDAWGNAINETLNVTGNGTVTTTLYFASVDANGVVAVGTFSVAVTQPRWGVVRKTSGTQYAFDCKIVVGDGSTATYFADTAKQIIFSADVLTAAGQSCIRVLANSNTTFGVLVDAATKTTNLGCTFYSLNSVYWGYLISSATSAADPNLYSCTFIANTFSNLNAKNAFNCFTQQWVEFERISTEAFNIFAIKAATAVRFGTPIANNIFAIGCTYVLRNYGNTGALSIKNVYARGCTYVLSCESVTGALTLYIINGDVDNWLFRWYLITGTPMVFRQYEFDLTTTKYDGTPLSTVTNGVAVTLTKGATVINLTTDANGKITTQTLSKGYYDQANGNTIQDAANWTLTVTATGYIPVTRVFSLDQKTSWMCALHTQLTGDAAATDIKVGKKAYSTDADTQLTGTLDQSDATAQEADIAQGKTAYNNFIKKTGALTLNATANPDDVFLGKTFHKNNLYTPETGTYQPPKTGAGSITTTMPSPQLEETQSKLIINLLQQKKLWKSQLACDP